MRCLAATWSACDFMRQNNMFRKLRTSFGWASVRKPEVDYPVVHGQGGMPQINGGNINGGSINGSGANPQNHKKKMKSETALQTPKRGMRHAIKAAWKLTKPYWQSEDKWKGAALLGSVVALTLGQVYLAVELNEWNNAFYNALEERNLPEFGKQLGVFGGLAATYIGAAVYAQYLMQGLQLRWRKWMTNDFSEKWLGNKAFYRLQTLYGNTDNPDQRISEDINGFTTRTLDLGIGLMKSTTMLGSFVGILWGLSGDLNFNAMGHDVNIPGYMVWAAVAYAGVGSWLTHKIGKPLVKMNYDQQKYEADYRFSLVRIRENAESIAFYGGEKVENKTLSGRFNKVATNWWSIMKKQKQLTWFTAGYNQLAVIFPILAASPRYFAGTMQLGGLMQTASAFGRVQESLSWFIDAYTEFADWKATTDRLTSFNDAIEQSNADAANQNELGAGPANENLATENAATAAVGAPPLRRVYKSKAGPGA